MSSADRLAVPDGYLPDSFLRCSFNNHCPEEGIHKKGFGRSYCSWHRRWNAYHPKAKLDIIERMHGRIDPPSAYYIDGDGMAHPKKRK